MAKLDVLLHSTKPCYTCGDWLQGKCVLSLSEPLKFQTFYVEMEGESYAHWTRRRNKKTVSYTSKVPYLQIKQVLLVSNDATNNESIKLEAGTYEYAFAFQIPLGELPSSFQSNTGYIRYWLKAKVVRNWAPDIKTVVNFAMYNPPIYDPNVRPIEVSRQKELCCGCCASEPITVQVILNKTGFQFGECVLISANFINPTDREMTPKVKLMTRITYSARGAQKVEEVSLVKMTDQPLTEDTNLVWKDKAFLIPETVNSIINCENIRLEHFLKVTLDIPGSINVNIEYPIIIGLPALNHLPLTYPPNFNPSQPQPPGFVYNNNPLPTVTNQPQPSAPFHAEGYDFPEQRPEASNHDPLLPSYSEYASGPTENVEKAMNA